MSIHELSLDAATPGEKGRCTSTASSSGMCSACSASRLRLGAAQPLPEAGCTPAATVAGVTAFPAPAPHAAGQAQKRHARR